MTDNPSSFRPQEAGWQSIESAPRDGTPVLLIGKYPQAVGWSDIYQGWWDKFLNDCEGAFTRWPHMFAPTHFMAMPAPPATPPEALVTTGAEPKASELKDNPERAVAEAATPVEERLRKAAHGSIHERSMVLLNEAADTITDLRAKLAAAEEQAERWAQVAETGFAKRKAAEERVRALEGVVVRNVDVMTCAGSDEAIVSSLLSTTPEGSE
jgi:hypothetical protein